jgi:hypothetical protein
MGAVRRVVELLIQGKDLSGRATATAAAGLQRLKTVAKNVFSNIRAASNNALRGFQERAGHRLFDGALSAVSGFVRGALWASAEVQEGNQKLQHSVGAIGLEYEKVAGQVEAAAARAMETSFFDDDEAKAGIAAVIEQTNNYKFAIQEVGLVADIATKRGISMAEAGEIVGKAYNGNTKALKSLGIYTRDASKAVEELHRKFDGAARGGLDTAAGQARAAQRDLGELQEEISGVLAPTLLRLTQILRLLTRWISENRVAIQQWIAWIVGMMVVLQITSGVMGLVGAARTLATTLGVSLARVVLLGGPLLIGLTALSAIFVKNRIDALNAAAAADRYRNSLLAMSRAELVAEQSRIARERSEQEAERARLQSEGEYSRRARKTHITSAGATPAQAMENARADAGVPVITPAGQRVNTAISALEARATAVQDAINELEKRESEIGPIGGITPPETPSKDRGREKSGSEAAVTKPKLDALGQEIPEKLAADVERQIALLERANELQQATPAMVDAARQRVEQLNQALSQGVQSEEHRQEVMGRIARLQDAARVSDEAEITSLEEAAGRRALNAAEMARIVDLTADLNVLQGEAVGDEREQGRLMEMQRRLTALAVGEQEREKSFLIAARELRRLTPDERGRLVLLRQQLEAQIQANLGTAEELRLRRELAELDPDSGGLTSGERNTGPGWLRDAGLTSSGIADGMREALGAVQSLDKAVGGSLVRSFNRLGEAAGLAVGALLEGNLSWRSFADLGKAAVADLADTYAQFFFAKSASEVAAGLGLGGSPKNFASAAKWFLAGTAMKGIGAAASGSFGGGGGGGSASSTADSVSGQANRGRSELRIRGRGFLDLSDPRVQDGLAAAIDGLGERDRIDVTFE